MVCKLLYTQVILLQVLQDAFDACDLAADPLMVWADPSVDNSVTISHLVPGSYYFICGVSGHCDAGMKLEMIVQPNDGLPVLFNPVKALCLLEPCAFTYSIHNTPQLSSNSVSHDTYAVSYCYVCTQLH